MPNVFKKTFPKLICRKPALLLGAGLLAMATCGNALLPVAAHAEISGCRTDPIVKLTDGTLVHLQTFVQDNASDVQSITYTIHAPAGVGIEKVTDTGSVLRDQDFVQLGTSDTAGGYSADTVVTTWAAGVTVSTVMTVPGSGSDSASGLSGDTLHTIVGG